MNDQATLEKTRGVSRSRRYLLELLAIGFVVLLIAKLSYDLPASRDVGGTDEPAYIARGTQLEQIGLMHAAFSPLYPVLYYLESLIASDRIELFDLHWLVITSLISLSGYFVMRRLQVSRPVALCGTCLILSSNMIFVEPMPPHLSTALLGFGTALALCFRQPSSSLTVIGITLAIASFIRPELAPLLVVSFLVCLVIAGVILYRSPSHWKSVVLSVAVFGVSVTSLLYLFGNPMKGPRGLIAFGQHYSLNVWKHGDKLKNPWVFWEEYMERDFPGAESISEAMLTNPKAFSWHISLNIVNFWDSFRRVIDVQLDTPKLLSRVCLAGWILAGLTGLMVSFRRLKRERPAPAGWPWPLLLILAVVLMQISVTSILIHPRQHYLVPTCFFVFVVASWGVDRLLRHSRWQASRSAPGVLAAAGILLLACLPNRTHGWNLQQLVGLRESNSPPYLVVRETARTLQQLSIDQPVTILAQDSIFPFYASLQYREVIPSKDRKTESFWEYLDQHQVTLALIRTRAELRQFGENPLDCAPDEFRLYQVENSPFWITVHQDVLHDRIARR